jgi:hypothetical protein
MKPTIIAAVAALSIALTTGPYAQDGTKQTLREFG